MGAVIKAKAEQDQRKKREQWFTDSTNRMTSMQKQLDEISGMYKKQQERRAARRARGHRAATVGQQMGSTGGTGLRISQTGGMSPSARRRMRRAG